MNYLEPNCRERLNQAFVSDPTSETYRSRMTVIEVDASETGVKAIHYSNILRSPRLQETIFMLYQTTQRHPVSMQSVRVDRSSRSTGKGTDLRNRAVSLLRTSWSLCCFRTFIHDYQNYQLPHPRGHPRRSSSATKGSFLGGTVMHIGASSILARASHTQNSNSHDSTATFNIVTYSRAHHPWTSDRLLINKCLKGLMCLKTFMHCLFV